MISDTKAAEARTSWNNQNPGIRGGEQQQLQEEDFVVMQMEIAWGVNEMHRYKKRHGDYPTRSESSFSAMTTSDGAGFADESLIEEDYLDSLGDDNINEDDLDMLYGEEQIATSVATKSVYRDESSDVTTAAPPDSEANISSGLRRGIRSQGGAFSQEGSIARSNNPSTHAEDLPDELALLLGTKTARTVEEYWDSLVAMF